MRCLTAESIQVESSHLGAAPLEKRMRLVGVPSHDGLDEKIFMYGGQLFSKLIVPVSEAESDRLRRGQQTCEAFAGVKEVCQAICTGCRF